MLVRKSNCEVSMTLYQTPSRMNRRPLVTVMHCNGLRIQIATMHLESLDYVKTRCIQQKHVFSTLEEQEKPAESCLSLFCGDFNYDGDIESEEAKVVPHEYEDAWISAVNNQTAGVQPNQASHTYPGIGRIDRILFKTKGVTYNCTQIELLGTYPIPGLEGETEKERRPSDHFGLCATFRLV